MSLEILTNHMWAIILLIRLAELAFQACPDLSADTDTVTNLDGSHLVADFNGLANDLVADTNGERAVAPSASNGVNVGTTHTAALDLDINVTIFERFGLELWQWLGERSLGALHASCVPLSSQSRSICSGP